MAMEPIEFSFPMDAKECEGGYDREYVADDFARYFRAFLTSGIIADGGNIAESLQVVSNDDMTTTLKAGNLIIDGYRYELMKDMVFQHRAADGVLDRIDRISITMDTAEREIHAILREGEYSYNPIAPQCRRSSEYMDYVVADVRIVNGAIKITQANITDTRLSTELCGIAFPFWKLDTGQFFAQLNSFYNEFVLKSDRSYDEFVAWAEEKKAEITIWQGKEKAETDAWQKTEEDGFTEWKERFIEELESWAHGKMEIWTKEILEWFQNIRDQLTDDPALHLQEQIGNLNDLNTTAKDNLTAAINEVKAASGVTGVKGNKETTYRTGNVNITPANIGALPDSTVPVNKGGTGQTTAVNAANALINALSAGSDVPKDNDYYISQYVNGGTTTNTYHRIPVSKLWEYIKGKINVANDLNVLKPVETGKFTNDTITLNLKSDSTYLLVTREITASTGKIYGYRARMISMAKNFASDTASTANLATSTNAGVTISNITYASNQALKRDLPHGITLKATSTYEVSYALYEFANTYGLYWEDYYDANYA